MPIDPDDYYMRGETPIYRRPAANGGMVVDHLKFAPGASTTFTIAVAAGVTLHIWAWVVVQASTDLFYNITVDAIEVGPNANIINADVDSQIIGAFSASKAGLTAGSHTVALITDGPVPAAGGGITVWHVPNAVFRSQVNT